MRMLALCGPTTHAYRNATGSYMRRELYAAKFAMVAYIPSAYSYQESTKRMVAIRGPIADA